jgi:prevent-host-death family protein
LILVAILATIRGARLAGRTMKIMSAKDAKNGFGLLLDTARAEPVTIEKHGRPVVVVMACEEFERLLRQAEIARASGKRGNVEGA